MAGRNPVWGLTGGVGEVGEKLHGVERNPWIASVGARTGRRGPVGGGKPIQRAPEGGGWREKGDPRRARWRWWSWRAARLPGRRGCSGFVLGEGESGEQRVEHLLAKQMGRGRARQEGRSSRANSARTASRWRARQAATAATGWGELRAHHGRR